LSTIDVLLEKLRSSLGLIRVSQANQVDTSSHGRRKQTAVAIPGTVYVERTQGANGGGISLRMLRHGSQSVTDKSFTQVNLVDQQEKDSKKTIKITADAFNLGLVHLF